MFGNRYLMSVLLTYSHSIYIHIYFSGLPVNIYQHDRALSS